MILVRDDSELFLTEIVEPKGVKISAGSPWSLHLLAISLTQEFLSHLRNPTKEEECEILV